MAVDCISCREDRPAKVVARCVCGMAYGLERMGDP